jgi:hypothetical protein
MLRALLLQTIFAVHAIALTTAILIVVKPAPPFNYSREKSVKTLIQQSLIRSIYFTLCKQ